MPENIKSNSSRGFIAIIALLTVSSLVVIVAFTLSNNILAKKQISASLLSSTKSYYSAESGVEDALLRKIKNYNLPSGVLNLDGASVTQTLTINGNTTTIDSVSSHSGNARKLRTMLTVTTDEVSFYYGVQVGAGGLEMKNNSTVNGNIYSNGSVIGSSGAKITGDAYAAGNNKIENMTVGGDAYAHEIKTSKVCGDAHYQIIDANSTSFLNSPTLSYCAPPLTAGTAYSGQPDPSPQPMPISSADILSWEAAAETGGVYSDAAHCQPSDDTSLGPARLNCNFAPAAGIKITITGTIWVDGNITIGNGTKIELASGYGSTSGIIVADKPGSEATDGKIIISNNVTMCGSSGYNSGTGSCNPGNGSYILVLSTHSGVSTDAIQISNNADGAIFYAANGSAEISNNANIKEVTAYKLELENNARVIYESGLASAAFSSGPGGGWKIDRWNETQ